MNLYLITQSENNNYDSFDFAVVAAPDEETARNMDPWGHDESTLVSVTKLCAAAEGTLEGVIHTLDD